MLQERRRAGVTISQMRFLQHHLVKGKIFDIYYNAALSTHLPIAIKDIVLLMITNAGSSLAKVQKSTHPSHLLVFFQIHLCLVNFVNMLLGKSNNPGQRSHFLVRHFCHCFKLSACSVHHEFTNRSIFERFHFES